MGQDGKESKSGNRRSAKGPAGRKPAANPGQDDLWPEVKETAPGWPHDKGTAEPAEPTNQPTGGSGGVGEPRDRRTLQDLLVREGLLAARLAEGATSLEQLQELLVGQLPQNSLETRTRYAQSVLKWFFPDGLSSLVPRVAACYRDETLTADVLRCCYLMAEPIVGACVAESLFPLEVGMRVPAQYLDHFLRDHLGEEPPGRTRERLKSNLMRLGFLGRARGQLDQLRPLSPAPTATLVLLHHLFARVGPRTIEMRNLLAHPFWKYLGYKSPDEVRKVLRAADLAGLVGKYVVADQLEQVTTCFSLDELLARRARL